MLMTTLGWLPPLLVGLIWLGVVVYLMALATRFVAAVERIADRMGTQSRA